MVDYRSLKDNQSQAASLSSEHFLDFQEVKKEASEIKHTSVERKSGLTGRDISCRMAQ